MALYSDKVMDHFQHPRNVGKLPDADGVGEVGNAKCGDIMRMYIQVDPETQVITDVKFNTFGCGSAIATSSMATEMIKGKPVSEALQLTNRAVVEAFRPISSTALSLRKRRCGLLSGITTTGTASPTERNCGLAKDIAIPADIKKTPRSNAPGRCFSQSKIIVPV